MTAADAKSIGGRDGESLEQRRVDVARAGRLPRSATTRSMLTRAATKPSARPTHVASPALPRRRVPPAGLPRRRDAHGRSRRPRLDARGTSQARYLFGGALGDAAGSLVDLARAGSGVPAAIRERYPEAQYAVGYLPATGPSALEVTRPPRKTEPLDADGRSTVTLPTTPEADAAYSYSFEGDVEACPASTSPIARRSSSTRRRSTSRCRGRRCSSTRRPARRRRRGRRSVRADLRRRAGDRVASSASSGSPDPAQTVAGARPSWERREIPAGEWTVRTGAGERRCRFRARRRLLHPARDRARRERPADAHRAPLLCARARPSSWRSRGQPHRADAGAQDVEAGRDGAHPHPVAVAARDGARDRRARRHPQPSSFDDHVHAGHRGGAGHRGRRAEHVRLGAAGQGPDVRPSSRPIGSDPGSPAYRVGYTELTVDDASKRSARGRVRRSRGVPAAPVRERVGGRRGARRHARAPARSRSGRWTTGCCRSPSYKTPDVLKAIYVAKALQVMTADNRQRLMSRRPSAAPIGVQGGVAGGGVGGVVAPSPVLNASTAEMLTVAGLHRRRHRKSIRKDFRPLVFWLGSATTDADGRATTTVTLPDSLTTYRIMAVAGDQASRFGFGEREIRVTKPLTLLPAFPRFLAQGRSRVVRRRGDQHQQGGRRRRRDDSEPRSGDAAVRRRRDADGAARARRVGVREVRRASRAAPARARADDA